MIESLINEFDSRCDYVDARISDVSIETIILENGVSSNIFTNKKSLGVRVLRNGCFGMAYSDDVSKARSVFEQAFNNAGLSSRKFNDFIRPKSVSTSKAIKCKINSFDVEPASKIDLLKRQSSVFNNHPEIKNTVFIIQNDVSKINVFAPGVNVSQEFSNNVFRASITARVGDLIQSAGHNFSHLGGFEIIESIDFNSINDDLLGRVNRLLHARPARPCRANVVCDPKMAGLFFHEAVGHACEADAVINQASVFNGLNGKVIASSEVNLFDDPTINERGFYWFDDEGVKARRTSLIANGVLNGLIHSLSTASNMGVAPSGNGRCMSADFNPIPRMSNTVVTNGDLSFDELISEARDGFLVKGFSGGVVDPVTGQFSFGASECFKISKGSISEPLRDVTLAGSILDVLKTIRVGNDYSPTFLSGSCGKSGQSVRVGNANPSILAGGVIVGGRS